ncbi:MAG: divalent cation tolerance protein CutA [Oscillospiraceae bacterium]|jgi:periplasmic divalent cation tolerance protein|nr:divalent cation tolerance protein CutA [Oscillospiraceae bacterium]
MPSEYALILTTYPREEAARAAARELVERRLAPAAQVFPIGSVYRWKGAIRHESEYMLLITAKAAMYAAIEEFISTHHTYETPELLRLPVAGGLPDYLRWIDRESGNTAVPPPAP